MAILSKPSQAARWSLVYITIGSLMVVWSGIRFVFLLREAHPDSSVPYYWTTGFLISGFVLLVIGLAIGQIGRAARHAELPPPEVTPAAIQATENAAARAPIVAPGNPGAGAVVSQGQGGGAPQAAPPVTAVPVGGVAATPAAPPAQQAPQVRR